MSAMSTPAEGYTYYRFKEVIDPGDEKAIMLKIQDRGDRVLVKDMRFYDWVIQPTNEYPKADLVELPFPEAEKMYEAMLVEKHKQERR